MLVNPRSNAIKFTETGEVMVGTEVIDLQTASVELHAWVRDTGAGLSAEEISRLFQPFVQADSSTTRRTAALAWASSSAASGSNAWAASCGWRAPRGQPCRPAPRGIE